MRREERKKTTFLTVFQAGDLPHKVLLSTVCTSSDTTRHDTTRRQTVGCRHAINRLSIVTQNAQPSIEWEKTWGHAGARECLGAEGQSDQDIPRDLGA